MYRLQNGKLQAVVYGDDLMRRLKTGLYLIEPMVRRTLVELWSWCCTHRDSSGTTSRAAHGALWDEVEPVMEKMRKGQPMTADEVRVVVAWRSPLGANLNRDRAYAKFIQKLVELGQSDKSLLHRELLKAVQ